MTVESRTTHHLTADQVHYAWDNSLPPRLTIRSGDTVEFETRDAADGHFQPDSTSADILTRVFKGHPLTGPVAIEGARAGDVIQVEILSVDAASYGWTAVIPGRGLLPEDFPNPHL